MQRMTRAVFVSSEDSPSLARLSDSTVGSWKAKCKLKSQTAFRISVQTDETLFRPTTPYIVESFCFRLHVAEGFDRFQTLRNNTQQHATGCANGRNM